MAITNVDFSVNFFVDKTSSRFVITDTTDYASQGVTVGDLTGVLRIVSPTGVVVYDNNDFNAPDIDYSATRISDYVSVPVYVGTNNPIQGVYTISLIVSEDDGDTSFTSTIEVDYRATKPVSALEVTVDCVSPLLSSVDKTSYSINGVTPLTSSLITVANSVTNEVTVSGNKSGMYIDLQKVYIVGSANNDGEYTINTVEYDQSANTTVIRFTSANTLTNNTAGGLLYTRINQIFYPSVLGLSPLNGYTNTVSTSTFYTGNQEFSNKGYWFYQFSNYSVTFYLEKTLSKEVTCDINLCEIYCCISKTLSNYLQYKGVNDVLANNYKNAYILACSYLVSLQTQIKCGNSNNVDKVVAEIRSITNCTSDCNCSDTDGEPVMIQGVGGGANVDVVSGSNGLVVTPTVSGNTTTFTLTLDSAITSALANIVDVQLTDSSTIAVNEVIDGNGNKTYTPAIKSGVIPSVQESMSFKVLIEFRNSTFPYNVKGNVAFTVSDIEYTAQLDYQLPTIENVSSTILNYPNVQNFFAITDFQQSSDNFKVVGNVIKTVGWDGSATLPASDNLVYVNLLRLNIVKTVSNNIVFTLNTSNTSNISQTHLNGNYQSVLINFIITK